MHAKIETTHAPWTYAPQRGCIEYAVLRNDQQSSAEHNKR